MSPEPSADEAERVFAWAQHEAAENAKKLIAQGVFALPLPALQNRDAHGQAEEAPGLDEVLARVPVLVLVALRSDPGRRDDRLRAQGRLVVVLPEVVFEQFGGALAALGLEAPALDSFGARQFLA